MREPGGPHEAIAVHGAAGVLDLKEADAGGSVKEVCRRHGISPATYYQWKSKYGGLQPSDLKKMKELERENAG